MRQPMFKKSVAARGSRRKGVVAVLAALLLPIMIGMLAFAIDCGYLLRKRAELQRAADAAALAAVRELVPESDGSQNTDTARDRVRQFAAANIIDVENFTVLDSDIEIGRYDPDTIYNGVTLLDSGVFDTVRVTLRRDSAANSPVPLFFAGIFGVLDSEVRATATAVLQKASIMEPGSGVLPFTIPQNEWDATNPGDVWSVYGDGKIEDASGNDIPGNWGTCDIGNANNSTADLRDQILTGLRQEDLDALHSDGRIPLNTHIDSTEDFYASGDPGFSAGMKSAVQAIHGQKRLIPIIDSVSGHGGNLEFHVVGWAVCEVVDSNWQGNKKTWVNIKKSFLYDSILKPQRDLGIAIGVIEGASTIPALVE